MDTVVSLLKDHEFSIPESMELLFAVKLAKNEADAHTLSLASSHDISMERPFRVGEEDINLVYLVYVHYAPISVRIKLKNRLDIICAVPYHNGPIEHLISLCLRNGNTSMLATAVATEKSKLYLDLDEERTLSNMMASHNLTLLLDQACGVMGYFANISPITSIFRNHSHELCTIILDRKQRGVPSDAIIALLFILASSGRSIPDDIKGRIGNYILHIFAQKATPDMFMFMLEEHYDLFKNWIMHFLVNRKNTSGRNNACNMVQSLLVRFPHLLAGKEDPRILPWVMTSFPNVVCQMIDDGTICANLMTVHEFKVAGITIDHETTLLNLSIRLEKPEIARRLIYHPDIDLLATDDKSHTTALHVACSRQNAQLVREILVAMGGFVPQFITKTLPRASMKPEIVRPFLVWTDEETYSVMVLGQRDLRKSVAEVFREESFARVALSGATTLIKWGHLAADEGKEDQTSRFARIVQGISWNSIMTIINYACGKPEDAPISDLEHYQALSAMHFFLKKRK